VRAVERERCGAYAVLEVGECGDQLRHSASFDRVEVAGSFAADAGE
jgi:hypothetical protein